MREEALRTVLLGKAIEDADPEGRWMALPDREAATREARREIERVSGAGALRSPSGLEAALVERAQRLMAPLLQQHPVLVPLTAPLAVPWWARAAVLMVAFAIGLSLAALDGSRRIDILALPILGVVGWNLLVYLWYVVARLRRAFRGGARGLPAGRHWLGKAIGRRYARFAARPAGLVPPFDAAAAHFAAGLGEATAASIGRDLRRMLHLAAAAVALGLLAGLYLRGIVFRFEAGWESTFLGPRQVLGIMHLMYGPVAGWVQIDLPRSVEAVAALRWTQEGGGGDAAPWIHLIALCLVLYVVLPRLGLAAVETFAALRLRRTIELPAPLVAFGESLYGPGAGLTASAPGSIVNLSLISHTNAGKTTLARTLLRRDVGEVRDAPHVTTSATAYELIATPQGDVLQLWDTPGFNGTERLAERLHRSANPVGWLLAQVWDRVTDRDFFLSQRAVRNVRDHTDVVLCVVDASEEPGAAGYLEPEMSILGWIGKPVLVLLNQLGSPRSPDVELGRLREWRAELARFACVRDVLEFDAFARCWVQEHTLLERVGALLPPAKQPAFDRAALRWRERNEDVFNRSMQVLARQLAATATDVVTIGGRSLGETARAWFGGEERDDAAAERAAGELATRLDGEVRRATDELIRLHGLSGQAAAEVLARMGREVTVSKSADLARVSVLGGALTGALGGLAADLAAGGLTFGAGALIGGLLGIAGARTAARAYNLARGVDRSTVRWSGDFLSGRVVAAVMRYLAVAHFGRGRGEFAEDEFPWHWRSAVDAAVQSRKPRLDELWASAVNGAAPAELESGLAPLVTSVTGEVLRGLYPAADLPQ